MIEKNKNLKELLENKEFYIALDYIKDNSPDLDAYFDNGKKPLDYLFKSLYEEGKVDSNIKDMIKEFHSNGMSLEENTDEPYLFTAVYMNDLEMSDWLLKSNNYNTNDKSIALSLSFNQDVDYKIFKKMLEIFPEYNQNQEYKRELLFSMSEYGYPNSENKMFALMHTSQGINIKNANDQTLLHTLSKYGNSIILKAALSSHELDVNHKDKNGETALFNISKLDFNGNIDKDVIKKKLTLLVESGINVLTKNKDNKDAFEVNENIKDLKGYALSISVESKQSSKDRLNIRKPGRKF